MSDVKYVTTAKPKVGGAVYSAQLGRHCQQMQQQH